MNLEILKSAVSQALEVDPSALRTEVLLETLKDYDSLKALTLMVALDDLGIVISQSEVANLKSYGDIEQLAKTKLGIAN